MNPARPASRSETRWGLQLKLILSMLLVGVVPLMVGLGLAFWQGSREIQVVSGESFKALAEETARKVDLLMSDEVGRTSRIAADPSIILELEQRRDALLDMTEDERRRAVDRLKRRLGGQRPRGSPGHHGKQNGRPHSGISLGSQERSRSTDTASGPVCHQDAVHHRH